MGAENLSAFLADVEEADLERREDGLSFWEKHPDDPRRYEWLMATVHAAPHYPRDPAAWAEAEAASRGRNGAAIDMARRAEWDRKYPALREAFWSAPSTTDADRRFLRVGEIQEAYERLSDARARGEAIDARPAEADLIGFLRTYRAPAGDADSYEYTAAIFAVLTSGVAFAGETGGVEAQEALLSRIRMSGNAPAAQLGADLKTQMTDRPDQNRPWFAATQSRPPFEYRATPVARAVARRDELVRLRIQREKGRALWNSMPQSARFLWLNETLGHPPEFPDRFEDAIWTDAEAGSGGRRNEIALASDRSVAALEAAFVNDPSTTFDEKSVLAGLKLAMRARGLTERLPQTDPVANRVFLDDLRAYNVEYGQAHPLNFGLLSNVLIQYPRWGVSDAEAKDAFAPLLRSPLPTARSYARSIDNKIQAKSTPFEFKAPTLDGEPFDIASLRGKIVLVDHWTTICSSCIEAMPRIHEIYKRYQGRGFEVVSIAYDGRTNARMVRRIEREKGVTWTTLAGDDQWAVISRKYGYAGVPQYMLLNRDGTLYAGTGEVDLGRGLEALLDRMLAEEAQQEIGKTAPAVRSPNSPIARAG